MTNELQSFTKNKDFLVCVDSDGCAIDSMSIKHFNCFGPRMVDEWNLENWQEEMLKACGNKYHLIGDCNKVGNIKDAIC